MLLVRIVVMALFLAAGAIGCGGDDIVVGGMLPLTPTASTTPTTPGCHNQGESCTLNVDCCSGDCLGTACQ